MILRITNPKISSTISVLTRFYKVVINSAITIIQRIIATKVPITALLYAGVPRRGHLDLFAIPCTASQKALKSRNPPRFIALPI